MSAIKILHDQVNSKLFSEDILITKGEANELLKMFRLACVHLANLDAHDNAKPKSPDEWATYLQEAVKHD